MRRRASFDTLCRLTQVEVGTPDADPLEVAAPSESREFEYDDLGRLTKITFEDGKTMEYEYDEEGNVTKITENASSSTPKVTEFRYYGDNRLHEITYVRGEEGADSQTFTYFYDPGGRPLRLEYPEDTGIIAYFDDGATPTPDPGWDGNGQLRHLRYVKGGSTLIRRFEYCYDDAGNRISQKDIPGIGDSKLWVYEYDWLDRLARVALHTAADPGDLDRDLAATQSLYLYDAADTRIEFQVPNLNPALTETFEMVPVLQTSQLT